MSRSGYSEDCEDLWLWRQAVQRAIDGKRGQSFLKELLTTLDAMPNKRLISDELQDRSGEVCAIGSVGVARGIDMSKLDLENTDQIGKAFGIAPALVAEIEFMNDDDFYYSSKTPEQRWQSMRDWVAKQIRPEQHRAPHET